MSDVPIAFLLSGGLDSSLICSIVKRLLPDVEVHTFSIGIAGCPDLIAAKGVADFLGTTHHEFHFTVEEALSAVKEVVYYIESFEQVRASVPMYLLTKRISEKGFKVVLSGEGSDEIFGGYLYFHYAPNRDEMHRELVRKYSRLYLWDVLRANKVGHAGGVEVRCPYLDRDFVDVVMNTDPTLKMCNMSERPDGVHPKMEKYLLRKAFDDQD
jgi:asparagine synthase (glutamine-hydrolysing)